MSNQTLSPSLTLQPSPFDALAAADAWEPLRLAAQRAYAPLGAAGFMLRHRTEGDAGQVVGSLPDALLRALGNAEGDPVDDALAQTALPLCWQASALADSHPRSVYGALAQAGAAHGFSIVLRNARCTTRVDFYRAASGGFAGEGQLPQQAQLVLVALHLHEAAARVAQATALRACTLSARELECLSWSAQGKTSREVGMIMGISHRTVYFHLQNAAGKLQVYTTRHAISRAVALGLLPARSLSQR